MNPVTPDIKKGVRALDKELESTGFKEVSAPAEAQQLFDTFGTPYSLHSLDRTSNIGQVPSEYILIRKKEPLHLGNIKSTGSKEGVPVRTEAQHLNTFRTPHFLQSLDDDSSKLGQGPEHITETNPLHLANIKRTESNLEVWVPIETLHSRDSFETSDSWQLFGGTSNIAQPNKIITETTEPLLPNTIEHAGSNNDATLYLVEPSKPKSNLRSTRTLFRTNRLTRKQEIGYIMLFFGLTATATVSSVLLTKYFAESKSESKLHSGKSVLASSNAQSSILSNVQSSSNSSKQHVNTKEMYTGVTESTNSAINKGPDSVTNKTVDEKVKKVAVNLREAIDKLKKKYKSKESTDSTTIKESTNPTTKESTDSIIKHNHLNIKRAHSSMRKSIVYIIIAAALLFIVAGVFVFKIQQVKQKQKEEDLFTDMNTIQLVRQKRIKQ